MYPGMWLTWKISKMTKWICKDFFYWDKVQFVKRFCEKKKIHLRHSTRLSKFSWTFSLRFTIFFKVQRQGLIMIILHSLRNHTFIQLPWATTTNYTNDSQTVQLIIGHLNTVHIVMVVCFFSPNLIINSN